MIAEKFDEPVVVNERPQITRIKFYNSMTGHSVDYLIQEGEDITIYKKRYEAYLRRKISDETQRRYFDQLRGTSSISPSFRHMLDAEIRMVTSQALDSIHWTFEPQFTGVHNGS